MSRLVIVGALAAALALSACTEQSVKQHFSQEVTCPVERVEVRARTDLKPSIWLGREQPSDAIAADPGRLKMWQGKRDERLANADADDNIFEGAGMRRAKLPGMAKW